VLGEKEQKFWKGGTGYVGVAATGFRSQGGVEIESTKSGKRRNLIPRGNLSMRRQRRPYSYGKKGRPVRTQIHLLGVGFSCR